MPNTAGQSNFIMSFREDKSFSIAFQTHVSLDFLLVRQEEDFMGINCLVPHLRVIRTLPVSNASISVVDSITKTHQSMS
jgi:hypothetical protein